MLKVNHGIRLAVGLIDALAMKPVRREEALLRRAISLARYVRLCYGVEISLPVDREEQTIIFGGNTHQERIKAGLKFMCCDVESVFDAVETLANYLTDHDVLRLLVPRTPKLVALVREHPAELHYDVKQGVLMVRGDIMPFKSDLINAFTKADHRQVANRLVVWVNRSERAEEFKGAVFDLEDLLCFADYAGGIEHGMQFQLIKIELNRRGLGLMVNGRLANGLVVEDYRMMREILNLGHDLPAVSQAIEQLPDAVRGGTIDLAELMKKLDAAQSSIRG